MSIYKRVITEINKNRITEISSIDEMYKVINSMENRPHRGFSWKPNSAKKIPLDRLLAHSTTTDNIESIIKNGFLGTSPWYSTSTKTKTGRNESDKGFIGFAWDTKNKKLDSRFVSLYGTYTIFFTSSSAIKVYNEQDKENQILFDVNEPYEIKAIGKEKIDTDNRKERLWDLYDEDLNLTKQNVKFYNPRDKERSITHILK